LLLATSHDEASSFPAAIQEGLRRGTVIGDSILSASHNHRTEDAMSLDGRFLVDRAPQLALVSKRGGVNRPARVMV